MKEEVKREIQGKEREGDKDERQVRMRRYENKGGEEENEGKKEVREIQGRKRRNTTMKVRWGCEGKGNEKEKIMRVEGGKEKNG